MKKLLFILCLIPSIIVNAQTINWNDFDEKKLNRAVFDLLDTKRDYTFVDFPEANKVHRHLLWNYNKIGEKLTATELVTKLNQKVLVKSIAIIDSISVDKVKCIPCEPFKYYEDIAKRCVRDWDNPSDMFGMKGFITVTSYLHKKTNTLYVVGLVKSYTVD